MEATRARKSGLHNGRQYLKQQGTEQGRVCPPLPPRPGARDRDTTATKTRLLAGTQREQFQKIWGGLG